jgi:hypothetical protein
VEPQIKKQIEESAVELLGTAAPFVRQVEDRSLPATEVVEREQMALRPEGAAPLFIP